MVMYNCSCLDITRTHAPDPWSVADLLHVLLCRITHANDRFYLTFTGNDRIPMWEASSLTGLYDRFERWPVYMAPILGPTSERLWVCQYHGSTVAYLSGHWLTCPRHLSYTVFVADGISTLRVLISCTGTEAIACMVRVMGVLHS